MIAFISCLAVTSIVDETVKGKKRNNYNGTGTFAIGYV